MDKDTFAGRSIVSVSFFDLLGLVFIVLKMTGVIDWSWWAVLSPFWGPLLLLIVSAVVIYVIEKRRERK